MRTRTQSWRRAARRRRSAALGAHSTRGCVRWRDDAPVPERQRAHLGARGREALLVGRTETRESRAEARVVRVEQVAADGRRGLLGARAPAASSSSATVASAAARENRVGGRNSRTSSQLRAASTSPDEADDVASRSDARRIVVHTSARAVASAAWSPAATAVAASPSARSAIRKACGRPASRPATARSADETFARASAASPRISAVSASASASSTSPATFQGAGSVAVAAGASQRRLSRAAAATARTITYCAILTLSRAAACVTWPAIAVARPCAVRPSESACSGVNRRPARSCARSLET